MPSEPIEPIVAAPAVLEALALAPVAVPVPDEPVVSAVPPADDELPVVAVAPVPVLVSETLVGRVESREEVEPEEGDAAVLVTPALAEEQLSPALMAEQKASAAGRTSSAIWLIYVGFYDTALQHDLIHERVPTESDLLTTRSEHTSGGIGCNVSLVLARTLAGIVRLSAPD
jgi:hypothetical protein